MKISKKAQVSAFIAIGIVLIVIVAFLLYIVSVSIRKPSEKEVLKKQEAPSSMKPINTYITTCLDKVTAEGLDYVGKQGGRIYSEGPQWGPSMPFSSDWEGIMYVVHAEKSPDDPHNTDPYKTLYVISREDGSFYNSHLPALERVGDSGIDYNSIQNQLEVFLYNRIEMMYAHCGYDVDVLFGDEFDITLPTPDERKINVTMGKEDVFVHLTYPMEIKHNATGETTKLTDFYVSSKVRLRETYNFVANLINEEAAGNPITGGSSTPLITVEVLDNWYGRPDKNDDFIIVKDTLSKLEGKEYEFWFVRGDTT